MQLVPAMGPRAAAAAWGRPLGLLRPDYATLQPDLRQKPSQPLARAVFQSARRALVSARPAGLGPSAAAAFDSAPGRGGPGRNGHNNYGGPPAGSTLRAKVTEVKGYGSGFMVAYGRELPDAGDGPGGGGGGGRGGGGGGGRRGGRDGGSFLRSSVSHKIVGALHGIRVGDALLLIGRWEKHPTYGPQFRVSSFETDPSPPLDEAGMEDYLAEHIAGVGPKIAERIVETFGAAGTRAVLDAPDAAERLAAVPRLGLKLREGIKESWNEEQGVRPLLLFLQSVGVDAIMAQRVATALLKKHDNSAAAAEAAARADIFSAMRGLQIRGVDFKFIDRLADKMGSPADRPARAAAAILQALLDGGLAGGHVYLPWEQSGHGRLGLQKAAAALCRETQRQGCPAAAAAASPAAYALADWLEQGAQELENAHQLVREAPAIVELQGHGASSHFEHPLTRCYSRAMWQAEVDVAAGLSTRLGAAAAVAPASGPRAEAATKKAGSWLDGFESSEGFALSPQQRSFVVAAACGTPALVLTGGPGCGKTYTTYAAVRYLLAHGKRVRVCAPTGRAVQRLAGMLEEGGVLREKPASWQPGDGHDRDPHHSNDSPPALQCSTIHRLLEWRGGDGSRLFEKGKCDQLRDVDVLVVDEASMLNLTLAAALLNALPPGVQVIFVGDRDQLPSIAAGQVLADVLDSGVVPTWRLDQVFRQAKMSSIVASALAVNSGCVPEAELLPRMPLEQLLQNAPAVADTVRAGGRDALWLEADGGAASVAAGVEAVVTRLLPALGRRVNDIQVITPVNKGPAGRHALNDLLGPVLNPSRGRSAGATKGAGADEMVYHVGDRVIQMANDYDKDVFNGDVGRVVSISPRVESSGHGPCAMRAREAVVTVRFGGGRDSEARDVDYEGLEELAALAPAWAITVHKSQGSEYPVVVLALSKVYTLLLSRRLLYTALTRAKGLLVLVASQPVVAVAVANVADDGRYSHLRQRLERA